MVVFLRSDSTVSSASAHSRAKDLLYKWLPWSWLNAAYKINTSILYSYFTTFFNGGSRCIVGYWQTNLTVATDCDQMYSKGSPDNSYQLSIYRVTDGPWGSIYLLKGIIGHCSVKTTSTIERPDNSTPSISLSNPPPPPYITVTNLIRHSNNNIYQLPLATPRGRHLSDTKSFVRCFIIHHRLIIDKQ